MTRRTDPRGKAAVALRYDTSLPAPLILGKATGRAAERAAELALESGVPVVEDEPVVMALIHLDVGDLVPPEYWEIVAKVFVFIRELGK